MQAPRLPVILAIGSALTVGGVLYRRAQASSACDCSTSGSAEASIPVACNLGAFTPSERRQHAADADALLARVDSVTELEDGFVLRFRDAAPGRVGELAPLLAQWTKDESRCCPFFAFQVDAAPGRKASLTITGPAGSKEILRAPLAPHLAAQR